MTQEPVTDLEKIQANATLVVNQFRSHGELQGQFGYSRDSVKRVEEFIEKLRKSADITPEKQEHFVQVFGCYLGECVIRAYGGNWLLGDDGWGVFFDERNGVFPFSKVRKQFQNGIENGDSILSFFEIIPEVFAMKK